MQQPTHTYPVNRYAVRRGPPADEATPDAAAQPAAPATEETSRQDAARSFAARMMPDNPSSAGRQEIPATEPGGKPRRKILRAKKFTG